MTFVIAGDCCSDASCVSVCPMNCIHPAPGEPGFGTTSELFIDPRTCIDCGACADVCPVDAAKPAELATADEIAVNSSYYVGSEPVDAFDLDSWGPARFDPWTGGPRRVAVVGAGPAGMYATRELLLRSTASIDLFDRLPVVGGLARFGVAPDHPGTKRVVETFERIVDHHRVRWLPGTEFEGSYDAVVHASGAFHSRRLGIPGESLAIAADDFVAWYNGRPGRLGVRLEGPRAVVVGNGNVALDIARMLVSDERRLTGLSLPPDVLGALAGSGITEVVVVGRRGPEAAAYTESGFRDLQTMDGVEVVVDDRLDLSEQPRPGRRIVLRFDSRPTEWSPGIGLTIETGSEPGLAVDAGSEPSLSVEASSGATRAVGARGEGIRNATIRAGSLVTAIGFSGRPIPGLPFDERRGVIPNERGAVIGRPGHYVTGWIKRGAQGGIGANKACAEETVRTMLSSEAKLHAGNIAVAPGQRA